MGRLLIARSHPEHGRVKVNCLSVVVAPGQRLWRVKGAFEVEGGSGTWEGQGIASESLDLRAALRESLTESPLSRETRRSVLRILNSGRRKRRGALSSAEWPRSLC